MNFSNSSVLIAGQKVNSRTETVEAYCKKRFQRVGVYAFSSPLINHGEGRWTVHENGAIAINQSFPSRCIRAGTGVWLILPWVFLGIVWRGLRLIRAHAFKSKMLASGTPPWDLFIGIAMLSTLLGLLFRRLGLVQKVIYYCLDYYVPPEKFSLHRLVCLISIRLDRWTARQCDENWLICDVISGARRDHAGLSPNDYPWVEVPLGYDETNLMHPEPDEFEPYSLGFVGSVIVAQGFYLILEALPELLKEFPSLKFHVVGTGPFVPILKKLAKEKGLDRVIICHGFIREESEVSRILSRCALGLALWISEEMDNARYADPGKPKLYAMCGVPSIISDIPKIAGVMHRNLAGRAIPNERTALVAAIHEILGDQALLRKMRLATRKFSMENCLASKHFDRAFERSLFCES